MPKPNDNLLRALLASDPQRQFLDEVALGGLGAAGRDPTGYSQADMGDDWFLNLPRARSADDNLARGRRGVGEMTPTQRARPPTTQWIS